MIETKDIYWLAGLLEGEGCFKERMAGEKKRRTSLVIIVAMSDRDVIQRVRDVTGATGKISVQHNEGSSRPGSTRSLYRLVIAGRRAVGFMMTVYPLMGQRRQLRIREILQEWRRHPPRGKWLRRAGYKHDDGLSRAEN